MKFDFKLYGSRKRAIITIVSFCLMLVAAFLFYKTSRYALLDEQSYTYTRSFEGISWGSSSERVIDEYGPSHLDTVTRKPVLPEASISGFSLEYADLTFSGDTGSLQFVFHEKKGLVKGVKSIQFGRGDDCEKKFQKYRSKLSERLGNLEPREIEYNELDVPFCNAVLLHKARRVVLWEHPGTGTVITLSVGLGSEPRNHINILFESHHYYDWIDEVNPSRTGNYLQRWFGFLG